MQILETFCFESARIASRLTRPLKGGAPQALSWWDSGRLVSWSEASRGDCCCSPDFGHKLATKPASEVAPLLLQCSVHAPQSPHVPDVSGPVRGGQQASVGQPRVPARHLLPADPEHRQ